MKSNQNKDKQVKYVNVCQYCGSEKELKAIHSQLWGTSYICRACEIKAIKATAKVGK